MKELKGACIIGQSGGPTSVINASAYGVIDTALKSPCITQVLGAEHGIKGVLNDRLFDMGLEDPEELRLLKYTPSSALGSCRYKIADPEKDDTDYRRILEVFKKHNVRYFFYNGGNDSMDTCNKINTYMQSVGYECRVMGVPKTIDNDLFGTDHCPGYASAAKYIATSMMEVYHDAHVYDTGMIVVMEIMGRHAGWLAASAALASEYGAGPDLIYLPETDFSMPKFIEDVKRIYAEKGSCIIAVSEGIHYEDGGFVSEAKVAANDGFGHAQLGGLAAILAQVLKEETGAKVRGIELNLLQRCGAHLASETDIEESFMAGKAAVENARIRLAYTKVTSPISGRSGRSLVTPGALVTENQSSPLTTVQQLDPVYVDVTQSSTEVLRLKRSLEDGTLQRADQDHAAVRLLLEDGSEYGLTGTLQFADVSVDESTGMVTLRAIFPNPKQELLPGMYVRAILNEGVDDQAILLPQRALLRDAKGNPTTYVVNAENKVEIRPLKVGRTQGNSWVVLDGLKAGDKVIVEGLQKIRPGSPVRIAEPTPVKQGAPASEKR